MKLMEFYYRIWGESLNAGSKNKDSFFRDYFKSIAFFMLSFFESMFILAIDALLWYFDFSISHALCFSQDKFVGSLQLMLTTSVPFWVLNYFLIFYKEKYKQLMVKYNTGNKKFLASIVFVPILILSLAIYSHLIMKIFTGNEYLPG
jgi:hypothetical protein